MENEERGSAETRNDLAGARSASEVRSGADEGKVNVNKERQGKETRMGRRTR